MEGGSALVAMGILGRLLPLSRSTVLAGGAPL
jgi:hypothetical protein